MADRFFDIEYDRNWFKVSPGSVPDIKVTPPGPRSRELHSRAERIMKGYSSQVRLFPVAFEKGHGVTLTDVDGKPTSTFHRGYT